MKEDLRVLRTKKLLLNSLLKLTIDDGRKLADISVQEICEEAMVHRTTFYRYYTDKYDLLFQQASPFDPFSNENRRKNIVAPFTFFLENAPFPNHEKLILNNMDDIHLQETIHSNVMKQLTKDLSEFISLKTLPVPLEIAVQVYANTIGNLLTYWLKNDKQPDAATMDQYLRATLNPFYFDLLSDE